MTICWFIGLGLGIGVYSILFHCQLINRTHMVFGHSIKAALHVISFMCSSVPFPRVLVTST